MTLVFDTIRQRVYPFILNDDDMVDREKMEKMGFPAEVICYYEFLKEKGHEITPEVYYKDTMDCSINYYLKKHNITKEQLHTIRKLPGVYFLSEAEIVYEDNQ